MTYIRTGYCSKRKTNKMDVKVEGYVNCANTENIPMETLTPFDSVFVPAVKKEFKSEVQDGSHCDVIVKLETCMEEKDYVPASEEIRLEDLTLQNADEEIKRAQCLEPRKNSRYCDRSIIYRICDICGKAFTHISNFKRHKMIHSEEKPYECEVCGKGFGVPRDLKSHQQIHSGHRPYKCEICGKLFGRPGHLKSHKMTHSGEKPYICDLCGKAFGHKDTLKCHKRIHSGEKPHKCDICGKMFSHRGTLTSHKIGHTGKRPHQCDMCGKMFVRLWHLKTHKQLIHFPKKEK